MPCSHLSDCSRSKDVIEPLLKPQWYVNCTDMARRAVEVRVGAGNVGALQQIYSE